MLSLSNRYSSTVTIIETLDRFGGKSGLKRLFLPLPNSPYYWGVSSVSVISRFQQRPIENRIGVMIDANRIAELSGQKNSEPILDFLHDPKHEARAVQTLDNAKKQLADPEEKSAKGVIGLDSVTVLPPIARPTKIICLGGNFSDHLQEGSEIGRAHV